MQDSPPNPDNDPSDPMEILSRMKTEGVQMLGRAEEIQSQLEQMLKTVSTQAEVIVILSKIFDKAASLYQVLDEHVLPDAVEKAKQDLWEAMDSTISKYPEGLIF
jgi:hypothetical protein